MRAGVESEPLDAMERAAVEEAKLRCMLTRQRIETLRRQDQLVTEQARRGSRRQDCALIFAALIVLFMLLGPGRLLAWQVTAPALAIVVLIVRASFDAGFGVRQSQP